MAYQLALPSNLKVHNVFHIYVLRKYIHDAIHVINWNDVQVQPEGDFLVEPNCFLDKREILLRNHAIRQVKVQWKHLSPKEATWEVESHMWAAYPIMFQGSSEGDE